MKRFLQEKGILFLMPGIFLLGVLLNVLPGTFLAADERNLAVTAFVAAVEYGTAFAGMILLIMERKRIRLLKGWIRLPEKFPAVAVLNPGMLIMLACFAGMLILI